MTRGGAECADCGTDTAPLDAQGDAVDGRWQWYMVHRHVWHQEAGMGVDGYLCIPCLERRLGNDTDSITYSVGAVMHG